MRLPALSAFAVSFLLTSTTAEADIITYNAASFALGVDVSHALDGVTLQRVHWPDVPNRSSATYAPIVSPAITSAPFYSEEPVSFGGASGLLEYEECSNFGSGSACGTEVSVLELTFDAPTSYLRLVSVTASGNARVLAYASDGTQIDVCANGGCLFEHIGSPAFNRTTITVTREHADIARVVWGGLTNVVFAQEISYSVPEPSTALLVGLGVGWVTLTGGRRRKISKHAHQQTKLSTTT